LLTRSLTDLGQRCIQDRIRQEKALPPQGIEQRPREQDQAGVPCPQDGTEGA
jgi:hypothetical protein